MKSTTLTTTQFEDYSYQRPDFHQLNKQFQRWLETFQQADSFATHSHALEQIDQLRKEYDSMYNICHIRHTIDTRDAFYEKENAFFDQTNPEYQGLVTQFYQALINSKYRAQLEQKWGKQLFVIAELSLKTFSPEVLDDLKEENRLSSEYVKIKAGAEIEVRGKTYNLSGLGALSSSPDRQLRLEAYQAKWAFYQEKAEQIESIFDQLVKVRHRIAKKLGFENFIELGYARMLRSDYDAEMVANFRHQILNKIVPLATKLYDRQRQRLGLTELKAYDEPFLFNSGNPKPIGEPEWIVEQADRMYRELSPETNQFFRYLQDAHLMDLVNREGKATGGYCTFVANEKAPFIFSNFNGTSDDIVVLTHEAGHAFQVYSSRNIPLVEYQWPTYEACEIHSMSMEFFTWPWMKLFFGENDALKFQFQHMASAIKFLPYGVAVDEFQHYVYANPDVSATERNEFWRTLEEKYLPHRDYDGNRFLQAGGFWQRQNHIFSNPFYYIDYTLAQICAFQFWKRNTEDHESTWKDYIKLCETGGEYSFVELTRLAGLISPFEDGCLESVVGQIDDWLSSVDDKQF
jgi:M3 family oligoendopeptidase